MPSSLSRVARRLRRGSPIVVVSGLPRSGTSMAMRMLEAGGLPLVIDGIRTADADNPNGYYELEAVKALDKGGDAKWLAGVRGKAVKIVSHLVTWLPEAYDYQVLFMERSLDEVMASQDKMLVNRDRVADAGDAAQVRSGYERHLEQTRRFLAARGCFSTLYLPYREVVEQPLPAARRIEAFLGRGLDVAAMAGVADRGLSPQSYRPLAVPQAGK